MPIGDLDLSAARHSRRPPLAAGLLAVLPLLGGCVLISEDELDWRMGQDAAEGTEDGLDGDCAPEDELVWYLDDDGDGLGNPRGFVRGCDQPAGTVTNFEDCNDSDAAIGALRTWYRDADGDGFGGSAALEACERPEGYVTESTDCDDGNLVVAPNAVEVCDGRDNNCDGLVDDSDPALDLSTATEFFADLDGDGAGDPAAPVLACELPDDHVETGLDCDDSEALAAPGLTEVCGDGIDNDCSGEAAACLLSGELSLSGAGVTYASTLRFAGTGGAIAGGRDLTGDGIDDMVVTATSADEGPGTDAGELYIVPGDGSVAVGTADLGVSSILRVQGDAAGDRFASTLALGDDLDGDGFDDLLAGTGYSDRGGTDAGAVYLFSGVVSGGTALAADAADAIVTGADPGDFAGFSLASAGDASGDGSSDLAIGAYKRGTNAAGAAYLIHGPITGTALTTADAQLAVEGEPVDRVGYSMVGGADLTGDGLPDLVFGADRASTELLARTGAVGVVSGDTTGTLALEDSDALVYGTAQDAAAGFALEHVGDADGDGYDDLLIGAPGDQGGAGAAWLMAGPLSGSTTTNDAHAWFLGDDGDELGKALAVLPDVDGDGDGELLLGARGSGRALVFYSPLAGARTASSADVTLLGAASSKAGASVAAGGDFNADGAPDLLIGQPGTNAATVVFGGAQ
jgi:hypothetical protein